MNDLNIDPGTKWVHVRGLSKNEPGIGLVHMIIEVDLEQEKGTPWITTFTTMNQRKVAKKGLSRKIAAGYTWRGSVDDFAQCFEEYTGE